MKGGMWGLGGVVLRVSAVAALLLLLSRLEEKISSPRIAAVTPVATPMPATTSSRLRIPQYSDPNIKSVLNITHRMKHGEFIWNEDNVPDGPVWVRVELSRQILSIFRAGHEIGTAVITYGAGPKPTPTGTFNVLWKRKDHQSSLYDAPMPYTLRLTNDGISIHGGDVRAGTATHGCVGIPIGLAERAFGEVRIGDSVMVLP